MESCAIFIICLCFPLVVFHKIGVQDVFWCKNNVEIQGDTYFLRFEKFLKFSHNVCVCPIFDNINASRYQLLVPHTADHNGFVACPMNAAKGFFSRRHCPPTHQKKKKKKNTLRAVPLATKIVALLKKRDGRRNPTGHLDIRSHKSNTSTQALGYMVGLQYTQKSIVQWSEIHRLQ